MVAPCQDLSRNGRWFQPVLSPRIDNIVTYTAGGYKHEMSEGPLHVERLPSIDDREGNQI